ncbi:DUF803-domain-containing protein [Dacryopinax primogenitus]|uniref:DUF803-domain-containing protein n=1 Tax=Dacryopinax primogenitus (strain DJM 731) TaxID=1858805 RepID=M5GFV7_DACPD|nr:DUF803-domain-containing protein [Dacryopinax primogenitus]EJU04478.1 DUF803-domain-containing protein [Dacryopinax primogenitus]
MSTTTASASASASTAASSLDSSPPAFKIVGVLLAVGSGLLIGSSFVFKKKGLLASQKGKVAGEGVAYLKSPMWWTGMTMMIMGELCNFAAYAFVEAIIVTPLGALSVVICAILSSIFLNEKLTFFGWIGCALCIVGSTIIALNGPQEQTVSTIPQFMQLFLSPGFLVYGSLAIASALVIIFYCAPRWGKKNMLWYIMICSVIGGLSVSCTQGLGAAIVTSVRGNSQLKQWFFYFLLVFVAMTLLTEIYFLNVALALFNTAMVTPTYYVIFTFFTLVTSIILYQGVKSTVIQIMTVVLGFLVICAGITILQMSKIDPTQLKGLDRKSTLLLQAARSQTEENEKGDLIGIEEPGLDAIRGSSGLIGSVIRARSAKRLSMSGAGSRYTSRHGPPTILEEGEVPHYGGMRRYQLSDSPVPPPLPSDASERISMYSNPTSLRIPSNNPAPKAQSIRFTDAALQPHGHSTPQMAPRQDSLHAEILDASSLRDVQGSDPLQASAFRNYDSDRSYRTQTAPASQSSFRDTYADPYSEDLPPIPARHSFDSMSEINSNRPNVGTMYSHAEEEESHSSTSEKARRGLFGRQHSDKHYPGVHGSDLDDEEAASLVAESMNSARAQDGSLQDTPESPGVRLLPKTPQRPGLI